MATLRDTIIKHAAQMDLTAHSLAQATDGVVSMRQLYRFFDGSSDLTSVRLDAVMKVLGLEIRPKRPRRR